MLTAAFNFLNEWKNKGVKCWDEICSANELAIRIKPVKKTETHRFVVTTISHEYAMELRKAK